MALAFVLVHIYIPPAAGSVASPTWAVKCQVTIGPDHDQRGPTTFYGPTDYVAIAVVLRRRRTSARTFAEDHQGLALHSCQCLAV